MHIIEPNGSIVVPRLYGDYSKKATLNKIIKALKNKKRKIPTYLKLLKKEYTAEKKHNAIFGMYCYWSGEARIGRIKEVLFTKPGFINRNEVLKVIFDTDQINILQFAEKIHNIKAASIFYAIDRSRIKMSKDFFKKVKPIKPDVFNYNPDADNYYLKNSPYQKLNLTEIQKTRINSAIGLNKNPDKYLSPAQIKNLQ